MAGNSCLVVLDLPFLLDSLGEKSFLTMWGSHKACEARTINKQGNRRIKELNTFVKSPWWTWIPSELPLLTIRTYLTLPLSHQFELVTLIWTASSYTEVILTACRNILLLAAYSAPRITWTIKSQLQGRPTQTSGRPAHLLQTLSRAERRVHHQGSFDSSPEARNCVPITWC